MITVLSQLNNYDDNKAQDLQHNGDGHHVDDLVNAHGIQTFLCMFPKTHT